MKFNTKLISGLLFCSLLFNCKSHNRKPFLITIENRSLWGSGLEYSLTEHTVLANSWISKGNGTVLNRYIRDLTKNESDSIYNFLLHLPYDTLKERYLQEHAYDGHYDVFKISGYNLKSKEVVLYMRSTNMTDTLRKLIKSQIHNLN